MTDNLNYAGYIEENLAAFPTIKRARGFRLYAGNGRRYLDFYLNSGRGVLGFRPEGVSGEIKSVLEKGLYSAYPSIYYRRLIKALTVWLNGPAATFIFADKAGLLKALGSVLEKDISWKDLCDPVFDIPSGTALALARPYLSIPDPARILVPLIPFPFGEGPWALCFRDFPVPEGLKSDPVSPILLAGACRAVYTMLKTPRKDDFAEWDFLESCNFFRRGIYFSFGGTEKKYVSLRKSLLDKGFLLDPAFPPINIIPAEYSPGELKGFKKALEECG